MDDESLRKQQMNIESRLDPTRPEYVVMLQTMPDSGPQRLLVHYTAIDDLVRLLQNFKQEIEVELKQSDDQRQLGL
ncbi:MAG: hypothetical protein SGJ19_05080 [Planctomycetia bacterium]|nr:hypothetical protein [Planctomycetia bacterium]